ncbi:MAG: cytochrome P450 [Anaerolineae bacterium]|nr:cytochrome P450 [Anaerolineae bacterium]
MTTTTMQTLAPSTLPGPRRIPFITHAANILRLSTQPLALLEDYHRRFGDFSAMTRFQNGKQGTVLAFGPEFNKTVLGNPALFHSPSLSMLGDSALTRLTSGLVSMNGERHKQQRRLMMPAFHKQAVSTYRDVMVGYTEKMLEGWQVGKQIDLMPEIRQLVLRIVSHTLFGLDDPTQDEQLGNLIYGWTRMSNSAPNVLFPPLRRQLNRLSEQLERELLAVINQKRAAGTPGNDVLSVLIQAHDEDGTRLTDTELIGHLAILFVAGHETTVNALGWTLILLARYPALRMALVEELKSTLGGAAPTTEQAYALPLLDYTIKESMRLLPPVVYTVRVGSEPFELGGYNLAKDSAVLLSHYITHRLPEIYANPDQFQPERWAALDVSPYEYLPFSAGARMCIGATFASLEMRIVLAMLLSRFQVMPLGKVDYQVAGSILQPKGTVPSMIGLPTERREALSFSSGLTQLIH